MNRKSWLLAGAALVAMAASTTSSMAQYSFSTYAEPSNPQSLNIETWIERVKERTDGAVGFEIYYGGALLPARNGLQGIGQGVAQAGAHVSTYTPSENALWTALSDVALKVPDPLAVAIAATEYGFFDPEGKGEWLDNGVVSLSGFSTANYSVLCGDANIKTLADLKGKRIRTPGGPWARFINAIGAVDVGLASSEIYTAVERGAVDCALADASHLIVGSTLLDITKSVVLTDVGPFFPGSALLINANTWNSISEEHRKIMLEETPEILVRREVEGFIKLAEDGLEAARAANVPIYEADDAFKAAYQDFLGTIDAEVIRAAKEAGVENIEQEIADFTALLTKWQRLLETVDRTDIPALTALVKAEIYDKVDVNTLTQR